MVGSQGKKYFVFFAPWKETPLEHHKGIQITKAGMELIRIANASLHPKFQAPFLNKMTEYGFDQNCFLPDHLAKKHIQEKLTNADLLANAAELKIDFNRYRVDPAEGSST